MQEKIISFIRKVIISISPPIIFSFVSALKNQLYNWKGNYPSWEIAQEKTTSYNHQTIFQKVEVAALKAKNKEIAYEQDGIEFTKIDYSWPLLTSLMLAIKCDQGDKKLSVCDFGGSLGSNYYRNKTFLNKINKLSWSIIEQKKFVDIGKEKFQDNRLKFYSDIDSCFKEQQPNIIILSSVLQYLEQPYKILNQLLDFKVKYVVLDTTPFLKKNTSKDVLKIQNVPPHLYSASYPCWIFNKKKLINYFKGKEYELLEEFQTPFHKEIRGFKFSFQGLIFSTQ